MGIINEAKAGADLTHPKASIGWVMGAVVAVFILMIAVAVGSWLYNKGKSAISGAGKTAGAGATNLLAGAFGDGT